MLYLYHVNTFAYHELNDQLLIGRTAGNLVYNDDGRMSGKHAQISVHEKEGVLTVTIEDLGSKNLSVVNRIQIPSLQKVRIKPLSLLEIGSQQFILTENKTMSLETLNEVMDHHMNKAIVKIEKDKTATNINYEKSPEFEDPNIAKEKLLLAYEKELATMDQNNRVELAKLDEVREKFLTGAKAKRADLTKKMATLKREVDEAKALKTELENKKKKIINLKDMAD